MLNNLVAGGITLAKVDKSNTKGKVKERTMCKAVDKIRGKMASDILKKYAPDPNGMVNMEALLRNMNIYAEPADLTKYDDGTDDDKVQGVVKTDRNYAYIYYSYNVSRAKQRYVMARDLGYLCFDPRYEEGNYGLIDYDTGTRFLNALNYDMNIFACQILMPSQLLKDVYCSVLYDSSTILADELCVPVDVVEFYLKFIGIPFYDKTGKVVRNGGEIE